MKFIVLIMMLAFSASSFADQVVTSCNLGPGQKITITKKDGKFYASIPGSPIQPLAGFQSLIGDQIAKEDMIVEIAPYIGVDITKVTQVDIYELSRDDDGGVTLLSYFNKKKLLKSALLTMGGPTPCL